MLKRLIAPLALAGAAAFALAGPDGSRDAEGATGGETRDALFVANNWEGTADFVDPHTFKRIARLNIIPDKDERLAEIATDPAAQGYFLAIREAVGEGHDQWADDMYSSHDGRFLYVSRPSLKDVVAFDLATKKIVWRTQVDGYRADHMAISPDGTHLLVSASTARKVHQIDTATGKISGSFESGDQPHENNFSQDGKLIFHASIGTVYTPGDDPAADAAKGDRWFEVVDAKSLKVLKRIDIGQKLEEAGFPGYSSAVRPMAIAPDERYFYFQLSFLHGFVEYDLEQDRPLRIANLPLSDEAKGLKREQYLLDSAHHGLAMNPEGTKLCVAGTMSNYAAVVQRSTFAYKILPVGQRPYWATNSGDGKYCFVSVAGDDRVAVISYAQEKEVGSIPVGDHPQRMRMGKLRIADYGAPEAVAAPGTVKPACQSRRTVALHVARRGSGVRSVRAYAGGKRIPAKALTGRRVRIDLRGLRKAQYKVTVVAKLRDGRTVRERRTLRTCAKKR